MTLIRSTGFPKVYMLIALTTALYATRMRYLYTRRARISIYIPEDDATLVTFISGTGREDYNYHWLRKLKNIATAQYSGETVSHDVWSLVQAAYSSKWASRLNGCIVLAGHSMGAIFLLQEADILRRNGVTCLGVLRFAMPVQLHFPEVPYRVVHVIGTLDCVAPPEYSQTHSGSALQNTVKNANHQNWALVDNEKELGTVFARADGCKHLTDRSQIQIAMDITQSFLDTLSFDISMFIRRVHNMSDIILGDYAKYSTCCAGILHY